MCALALDDLQNQVQAVEVLPKCPIPEVSVSLGGAYAKFAQLAVSCHPCSGCSGSGGGGSVQRAQLDYLARFGRSPVRGGGRQSVLRRQRRRLQKQRFTNR